MFLVVYFFFLQFYFDFFSSPCTLSDTFELLVWSEALVLDPGSSEQLSHVWCVLLSTCELWLIRDFLPIFIFSHSSSLSGSVKEKINLCLLNACWYRREKAFLLPGWIMNSSRLVSATTRVRDMGDVNFLFVFGMMESFGFDWSIYSAIVLRSCGMCCFEFTHSFPPSQLFFLFILPSHISLERVRIIQEYSWELFQKRVPKNCECLWNTQCFTPIFKWWF